MVCGIVSAAGRWRPGFINSQALFANREFWHSRVRCRNQFFHLKVKAISMRRKTTLMLTALLALVTAMPLVGQTVPKEQQAEVAIQLQMSRLRDSQLFDMVKQNIDQARAQSDIPDNVDIDKVDTVFAAIALPEDVASFAAMEQVEQGGDLPMEMYVRVTFTESGVVDTIMEKAAEESEERELNGKTVYTPREDDDAPGNIVVYRDGDSAIVFGTENYVSMEIGDHLLSAGLKSAWEKVPDQALRIAIDLENSSNLIDEAVAMAKANSDPMMGGFIDLITKASDIRMTMDLTSDNLMTLAATGKDETAASELQMGLDGILAMGKMGGAQAVQMLKEQDEDAARVMKEILDSLSAQQDGTDVQIASPRPEGFEDAIKNMMQMQMGGGGF